MEHHRIKLQSTRFPVLNDIECIFKQAWICETFEPCNVVEWLEHFDDIVPSLACILMKQRWHPRWKIPFENPWKLHFQDSKFQNVPRHLSPQEIMPLV